MLGATQSTWSPGGYDLKNIPALTSPHYRALFAQMLRYGVSGAAAALLYSLIYWLLAARCGVKPLVANGAAWLASLVSSYFLHSRWSFRGAARDPGSRRAKIRFLCINLAGLALNSFWVWLVVDAMKLDVRAPLLPIVLVTPGVMFYASRRWAFRAR
jgi:putative flippase GtrA